MENESKYGEQIEKKLERVRNIIKDARQKKNLSQNKFAKMLGMTSQNYRNIELGNNTLQYPMLLKIMDLLGIDSVEQSENDKPKYAIDDEFLRKIDKKLDKLEKLDKIEDMLKNGLTNETNNTILIEDKQENPKQLDQ